MEFCPALDTIGDYFIKSLQGYQFRRFQNLTIGIHKYGITYYIAPKREFIKERKVIIDKEKEEAHKYTKTADD